eukprot:3068552-Pyramimonas_sp.AAC.1
MGVSCTMPCATRVSQRHKRFESSPMKVVVPSICADLQSVAMSDIGMSTPSLRNAHSDTTCGGQCYSGAVLQWSRQYSAVKQYSRADSTAEQTVQQSR